jgi:hypothetical protein
MMERDKVGQSDRRAKGKLPDWDVTESQVGLVSERIASVLLTGVAETEKVLTLGGVGIIRTG